MTVTQTCFKYAPLYVLQQKEVINMGKIPMVHVSAYWRLRLNRLEFVSEHYRHYPRR